MSTELTSALQLPEWDIGVAKLRFVCLCAPFSFELCHKIQAEQSTIPLFLGADVLAPTHVRTENHTKVHAKFAKKGLASKLNFGSEFRFQRLKLPASVNSLWFYSIQGLFRVAFEMYNRDHQLAVLNSFQDLWKSRIKDNPLNQVYDIRTLLGSIPQQETQLGKPNSMDAAEKYDTLCGLTTEFLSKSQRDPTGESDNVATAQHPINMQFCNRDHNYCFLEHQETASSLVVSLEKNDDHPVLEEITSLTCIYKNLTACLEKDLETVVILLMETAKLLLEGSLCLARLTDLILQLLDHVYNLSSKDDSQKEKCPLYCSKLLFVISSWLGNRFCLENSSISQQVEEFKRQHIDRITDLPPAEELIDALFPEAMKALLINWMGLTEESAVQKLQSEYPILLLILEFANHNLITGVSHVLYSSLISK